MQTFTLFEDYITLGQLLKELGLISTGGAAKFFLSENPVIYNDTPENRRGKKLYAGDQLQIPSEGLNIKFIKASSEEVATHEVDIIKKDRINTLVKKMNSENKNKKGTKPKSPFHP